MKLVTAIIKPFKLQEVREELVDAVVVEVVVVVVVNVGVVVVLVSSSKK